MESFIQSFVLVFISEMGDKTQLLALVLAAKFKKPGAILLGILLATLLNHALASYIGSYFSQMFSPSILKGILSVTFIGFGVWMLFPDKDEGLKAEGKWGAFLTTLVAFFFAEMGDKTQLATMALGAKFADPILVTMGTTLAMMGADGLAVIFGHKLTERISMKTLNKLASLLFIIFGLAIWVGL